MQIVFYFFLTAYELHCHQDAPRIDSMQGGRVEEYERFLKAVVDSWFDSSMKQTPVSNCFYDNLWGMIAGYPPESCDIAGICSVQ